MAGSESAQHSSDAAYVPGVCNIGPAEIERRRQAGNAGVAASLGLLAILVAVRAPRRTRWLVTLPAAGAASGYLQARLRFCAGFGSRGVYNFGRLGTVNHVQAAEARRLDRARSARIGLASLGIGLAAGAASVALPI